MALLKKYRYKFNKWLGKTFGENANLDHLTLGQIAGALVGIIDMAGDAEDSAVYSIGELKGAVKTQLAEFGIKW